MDNMNRQYAPPQYAPPPPVLKRKKGYVSPIIWLIIGAFCCTGFFSVLLGIIIIIIALISLSMRVSYNHRVEVENAQVIMQYSAHFGARAPYNMG